MISPTTASTKMLSAADTTKKRARVARTTGPSERLCTTAMGGPPIDDVVPMVPDSTPAIASVTGVGRTWSPEATSATAMRTIAANSSPSVSSSTALRRAAPASVPGTSPVMATSSSRPIDGQPSRVVSSAS